MNALVPVRRFSRNALWATFLAVAMLSGTMAATAAPKLTRADLEVVDCLLPGQVRVLGNRTYLTARRPIKTNAADCRIRGGEYVDFDRASMKDALTVWQGAADGGDAEAQNNVGEIYERGMGVEPNYQAAALWYQKAADQGYSRAQFNLGTLYEQGLGVTADKLHALNLYRQSWGLPEDSVMFQSAAREEQDALRAELAKTIDEKDTQLNALKAQIRQLQNQISKQKVAQANAPVASSAEVDALNKQVDSLKKLVESIQSDRDRSNERLVALRTPTMAAASAAALATMKPAEVRKALGVDFGRYYALIIGNQHYQAIENLQTPISDAQRAAKVLKERYGFSVRVLEDANDMAMLNALNDLNGQLKDGDNLLIYYAGHGTRLQTGPREAGYWLPVNADKPPVDTLWVPNEQITAQLARMPARRVLVVADSCYAGLLSTDPSYRFVDAKAGYTLDYVKYKVPKRSRLLLSSGGDEPVLDKAGGGKNSVFADAFLEELETNTTVLSVPELFSRISRRVETVAARNNFVQKPEFKSIKGAGHDMGDFFFVPKS
ncbi:MAG: caspase family protein [Pseudomonadota bacterium]